MHLPPGEGICDNFSSVHDRQAFRRFVTIEFERNGNVDSVIGNGALAISPMPSKKAVSGLVTSFEGAATTPVF